MARVEPRANKSDCQKFPLGGIQPLSSRHLTCTLSLVLLRLNVGGFYIPDTISQYANADLTKQLNSVTLALIQVAVKVKVRWSAILSSENLNIDQETAEPLIITNFSTMLFQVIRDGLSHDGFPLELATSGLSFNRLSYVLSPGFWGGITSFVTLSKWKGVWLLSLISL